MTNILNTFLETNVTEKRIWIDMDGVLCNFVKRYMEYAHDKDMDMLIDLGIVGNTEIGTLEDDLRDYYVSNGLSKGKAKEKAKTRFWDVVRGDLSFWTSLEWENGAQDLTAYCFKLRDEGKVSEVNILSSPSEDPTCVAGKRGWLADHHLADKMNKIIFEKKKYLYVTSKGDILIDDTDKKIRDWVGAGGTGILHDDYQETLKTLRTIFE